MDEALFNELLESVKQAGAIHSGEMKPSREFHFPDPDISKIREQAGMSQSRFAAMIGVSVRTIQNWEQGHRKHQGPALALLRIFQNDPEHALHALHG